MGAHALITRSQTQETVAELLSITVGRKIDVAESVTRDNEPSWDSLKHVELVFMLEERFGVQFSEEEMAALRSSDEIVHALEEKSAA
jgi:acyl carrier protein